MPLKEGAAGTERKGNPNRDDVGKGAQVSDERIKSVGKKEQVVYQHTSEHTRVRGSDHEHATIRNEKKIAI